MSDPHRVILIRNISPNSFGGAENYQIILSRELTKYNIDPIVLTSSSQLLHKSAKSHIKSLKSPFLKHQNFSGWRNIFLPFYFLWQLYLYFWYKKVFKKIKPEVVNIQSRDDWIAATLAAKKLKIKILWTDHMDFRSWVLQNIEIKYKNIIAKVILKIASSVDQIIFISDYEYSHFKKITKKYKFQNLTIIKNGAIDSIDKYRNTRCISHRICYVGRLEDYKGINELIDAYNMVRSSHPDSALEIYGQGSLSEFCRNHQNEQIRYHGFTSDPLKAIAESEIFILPSYREGLSLSLLDAIMLGKTIIATNIDGNPELVEDRINGLLVKPKNTKLLADAMNKILSNRALSEKFSKASRLKYEKEYDFADIIKNNIHHYLRGD